MRICGVVFVIALVYTVSCTVESEKHGNPSHSKHYDANGGHDDAYDHEAVLGSEDEMRQYAQLPPEEAKKKLGELFVKMDDNQNGQLDVQELTKWIVKSFEKLNLEDTKEKMKTDDKNGDGSVSWEEFIVATYGMTEDELEDYRLHDVEDPEAKKTMEKSMAYDKNKFAAADENGDGQLTVEEAAAFMHPYDYPRMSEVESMRVLNDYDTNGDGKVSMEEYISHSSFRELSPEDLVGEKEHFSYNDANGDKHLDKKEIMKWVSPDIEETASSEATHLIEETDANKDGVLSVEEVKNQQELWVGSEATDYGDMLHDEL